MKSLQKIRDFIDLRDVFVFGGIAMMGYGLWLYRPWIAFTACGIALSAIGMFLGRGKT